MIDPIQARVQAIVADIAGAHRSPRDAAAATPLGANGYWLDSIDLLEVVLACEKAFDVRLSEVDDLTPDTLASVGTLTDLIRRKLG